MKTNLKKLMPDFNNPIPKFLGLLRSGPSICSLSLCAIAAIVIIASGNNESVRDIGNYETGKVADRDVIASISVSFTDEEATRLQLETIFKQTPAIFMFSGNANKSIIDSWNNFCDFTDALDGSISQRLLSTEAEYPGNFSAETLNVYLSSGNRASFRNYGSEALNIILNRGIISYHTHDIRFFNNEVLELQEEDGTSFGFILFEEITTRANLRETLGEIIKNIEAPAVFKAVAVDLIRPFVTENVFFSSAASQNRMNEIKEATPPVIRTIEKGQKIIKKNFIITEAEMDDLRAYHFSFKRRDPRNIVGLLLLVLLIYAHYVILQGQLILGKKLNNSEKYLLAALTGSYIIGAVLLNNFSPFTGFPLSLIMPTALFIMIFAVFMGTRTAMIMALALPLGAYLTGAFDNSSYIIALVSGAAASAVLHNAENRMSLIKAGLLIAAANSFAVIIVLLLRQAGLYDYPVMIFCATLNGIFSGMLILGFLPPLEHALNAVTTFRLMELSDLNAPILRKLFTAAPGTYSHSLMVANLAEQACQDIGANALLARVGAYYHDIGKMDNPDYFVENQTNHNRHDEIAPRLSATIIRSHVKLGVEKAHSLGLPRDVISIISEHHGNSVISWFYNKAVEQEDMVNTEDFIYPGSPPRSKESAVVMLADITEAAVRTLDKPTAGKIDKFIQQLFKDKVDHGQLSESELSFRDLEIIKKAFVKVLAGYYHSRIEYPKQKEEE